MGDLSVAVPSPHPTSAGLGEFRPRDGLAEGGPSALPRGWRLLELRDIWWSPTIRAAIVAGMPWLDVYFRAARQTGRSISAPSIAIRWRRSGAW
jgi:hypothetical protein